MASSTVPIQKAIVNEGGYAPAFGVNGETYKGIDRKQQPGWAGWKIIDQYKRQHGRIKQYAYINNQALENLVMDFYNKKFWPQSRAGELQNQTFAENYFDFYFHKPGIAKAALLAATGTDSLDDAIYYANQNQEDSYAAFYKLRLQHYNNQWNNKTADTRYVKTKATQIRRAERYPETLPSNQTDWASNSVVYSFLNYKQ